MAPPADPKDVASTTQTTYEIAFLNNSNTVLATNSYDLKNDPTIEAWSTNECRCWLPSARRRLACG